MKMVLKTKTKWTHLFLRRRVTCFLELLVNFWPRGCLFGYCKPVNDIDKRPQSFVCPSFTPFFWRSRRCSTGRQGSLGIFGRTWWLMKHKFKSSVQSWKTVLSFEKWQVAPRRTNNNHMHIHHLNEYDCHHHHHHHIHHHPPHYSHFHRKVHRRRSVVDFDPFHVWLAFLLHPKELFVEKDVRIIWT